MSMRIVAASTIAALHLLAGAPAAPAADLAGAPYDDDYYAESYAEPGGKAVIREEEIYKQRRYSERRTYVDEEPPPLPPRRVYDAPRYGGYGCVPRAEIRHALTADGWYDFHDVELHGGVALLRARRASGRLFDLRVDRCNGSIISTRPLDDRGYGPFAYGRRHWRTY